MSDNNGTPIFTHLRVQSSYSLGIGLATPEEICAHAKRSGYGSVALTDVNGTYGYVELHLAAKRHGIKPIYGAIVYHTSVINPGGERFTVPLLARSGAGLRNVTALTSLSATAYETGIAMVLEQFADIAQDVIALVGSPESEIGRLVLAGDESGATLVLREFRQVFGDRLFLEVQDHGDADEKVLAQKLLGLASAHDVPPVLTNDVRYASRGMRQTAQLLCGIQHPHQQEDFFKIDAHLPDRSMRTATELARLHDVYPEAYANTVRIDAMVEDDLFESVQPPTESLKPFGDPKPFLRERCRQRLRDLYGDVDESDRVILEGRITHELESMSAAGLVDKVLLYHRVLSRMRQTSIALGPATGLTLQSFSAYLLGITSYDPYVYDPEFEPMFEIHGEGPPELEIQIASEARDEALRVIGDTVGKKNVAYVPAVERITPARAVRMVSNVVEVGGGEVDEILGIIARHPGVSIKALCDADWQLGKVYRRSVPARDLLTRASLIEDFPCGFIKSRRSLALAGITLTDVLGHSVDADSGDVFIQGSRDVLPVPSIYRIDITTLGALNVIHHTESVLHGERERNGDRNNEVAGETTWDHIPINHETVWWEIQHGDPLGVFLFEGQMMQKQRESFQLRSIPDLTNLLALMRARGDDQTATQRLKSFQKGEVYSGSEPVEVFRVLRRTRGFLLYDEQLRDIVAGLSGMGPSDASRLLGLFKSATPAALSASRSEFMRGTADQGVPLEMANKWFERILYYARFTMSRERVVADALLVYKLFFLKAHHSTSFYVGLLNTYWQNDGRLKRYQVPLRRGDLLLGVDVNRSRFEFVLEDNRVRTGLCVVSGLDRAVAERIVSVRTKKEFASIENFVRRVGDQTISKGQVRQLVKAGAFDSLDESREVLDESLGKVYRRKPKKAKTKPRDQLELPFDA